MSLHLLGAEPARALLVRTDPLEVARSQGGLKGGLAATLVPQLTTSKVLEQMAGQFQQSLRDKGINATVSVVADTGQPEVASGKDLLVGMGLGGGAFAVLWFGGRWIMRRIWP